MSLEHQRPSGRGERAAAAELRNPLALQHGQAFDEAIRAEVEGMVVGEGQCREIPLQVAGGIVSAAEGIRLQPLRAPVAKHAFEIAHGEVGVEQQLGTGRERVVARGDGMPRPVVEHHVADEHDRHAARGRAMPLGGRRLGPGADAGQGGQPHQEPRTRSADRHASSVPCGPIPLTAEPVGDQADLR